MARIRDTAPVICRGFVIFEMRHAKRPGDLWISSTAVRYSSRGIVTPLRACGPAGGSVAKGMKKISYRGYRFPPEIIQQAIWLYSGSH
jgi:hypothetical protein